MKYLTVTTVENGKTTTEKVPMSEDMQESMKRLHALWKAFGCRCKKPHPDHTLITQRGHSVDVHCTDCGGIRQVG